RESPGEHPWRQAEPALLAEQCVLADFVQIEQHFAGDLTRGRAPEPGITHLRVPFGRPGERQLGVIEVANGLLAFDGNAEGENSCVERALRLAIAGHAGWPPKLPG